MYGCNDDLQLPYLSSLKSRFNQYVRFSNSRVLIGQKFDKLVKNALHSKKTLKKHHVWLLLSWSATADWALIVQTRGEHDMGIDRTCEQNTFRS